jgi:hypothetical protein
MKTHVDIIKLENSFDRKNLIFQEIGYDTVGLSIVHWINPKNNVELWDIIRSPVSNIEWKSRCTIMLLFELENHINIEK